MISRAWRDLCNELAQWDWPAIFLFFLPAIAAGVDALIWRIFGP